MQKLRNEMEADKKASEAAIRLEQAKQAQEKAENNDLKDRITMSEDVILDKLIKKD